MPQIIGILASIDDKKNTTALYHYVRSIEIAGGTPIVIPYCENEQVLDDILSLCDGFLFAGGADISPVCYAEEIKETCGQIIEPRDDFDFRAIKKILKTNKPILGICRGAQLINVALGGTLHQDIPTEIATNINHRQTEADEVCTHEVIIAKDSPLHKILRQERIGVNSFHHQCAKQLGKGLVSIAQADDGVPEAYYLPSHRYLFAIQWHPERLYDENSGKIFKDFVNTCKFCTRDAEDGIPYN